MKLFDSIWAISTEEHFLFSQFLSEKNVVLIPHGSIENFDNKKTNPEIDLLYVASDNPHNISSINWFFKEVYPILDKSIKITVIGKICNSIATYPNVTMVKYAESLSEYYENTKISLCPMLSGTGLKIKVVEALSYGIPVVCNQRGLDGLQNKIGNGCLSTESAVVFSEHISELINNREFYVKTSNHAKSFFQNTLSEKVVFDKLDQEFHIE